MGIPGFTKYINDRAHLYFENHELRDCSLIIDGHSISCQLYNWKHWQFDARSNNSYGGDYDQYAYIVENFFRMLAQVRVKPIVVFDGGFEQRKLPTILNRMQDKINIADKLDPDFESRQPHTVVFPLFLREAFKDILRNLDIEMVMCEYEGDSEIASIAKSLNCPVLTFDSDYFLFGAQYIPFKTLDSKVRAIENWRTGTYKCISCKLYRIETFLDSFPGLQENTLHLLPVLLGNDYIDRNLFSKFLQSLNISVNVNMQDTIQIVLDWLKSETPKSAINKILSSFKTIKERLYILNKIEKIVTSYYFVESRLFKYLNIVGRNERKFKKIDFKSIKEMVENENNENGSHSSECVDTCPEQVTECESFVSDIVEKVVPDLETSSKTESTDNRDNESQSHDVADNLPIGTDHNCEVPDNPKNNDLDAVEKQMEENRSDENANEETKYEVKSQENGIPVKSLENGETNSEKVENETEKFDDCDEEMPLNNIFDFEETHLEKENTSKNPISKVFKKNFTKCLYPSSFMDILTQNKYYCIPQIENHCQQSSHMLSFDILRAIHKILTSSSSAEFTIVGRSDGTKVKWFPQEQYTILVPSIEEIEQLPLQGRRETLFRILNIDNNFVTLLEHFPTEWHTFLVALKFAATKTTFDTPLIYSLILGFIILNYIDQRIGFYRSAEGYKKKYYSYMQNLPPTHEHVPFRADKNCFYYFPIIECVVFLQKVILFFTMDPRESSETFDKNLVHQMAQIQSVLLHIKYLNSLLKYPYPNLMIHQIFSGTFIYNLTKIFKEKSLGIENNYLNVFFKDCPTILAGLKYVLNMLNKQILL